MTTPFTLPPKANGSTERVAYRIREVSIMTGICRTNIYAAIKTGELKARKIGRSTLIMASDLADFMSKLPSLPVRLS